MQKILVILGPTATGKSALAVKLAKKFNGEIVSADSRQVYRGLNIGTGKTTKREMSGIPHHLLDVASPRQRFSVVKFQKLARHEIAAILRRGRLPIICGGTGFYIEATAGNIVLPDVRQNPKLRARLSGETTETLLNMLMKLDPRRAKSVDSKNSRRIIRAIEIAMALGKVPSVKKSPPLYDILRIGLTVPPETLKKKIAARLRARLKLGMVAEAKRLNTGGLSWKRMDELGLEYRYLAKYIKNEVSKSKMIEKLQTEIWRYVKRQMTWFRHNKRIEWFNPTDISNIQKCVQNFLGNNNKL